MKRRTETRENEEETDEKEIDFEDRKIRWREEGGFDTLLPLFQSQEEHSE